MILHKHMHVYTYIYIHKAMYVHVSLHVYIFIYIYINIDLRYIDIFICGSTATRRMVLQSASRIHLKPLGVRAVESKSSPMAMTQEPID